MVIGQGGESGSRRSEFVHKDNDDEAPSTLALSDKQPKHKHSLWQARFSRSPSHLRQTSIFKSSPIDTSQHSPWNKAEQSTRWHLSSLYQNRPLQLVQLPIWSLRLPQPLTPTSLASCSRHQTFRVCATMLNTVTTTHCSSYSPGAHGQNAKVYLHLAPSSAPIND